MRFFSRGGVILGLISCVAAFGQEVSIATRDELKSVEERPDPVKGDEQKKLLAEIATDAKRYDQNRRGEHSKNLRHIDETRGRDTAVDRSLREAAAAFRAGKLTPQ